MKQRHFKPQDPIFLNRASSCPYCLEGNDGATGLEDRKLPQPGDISICLYCCEVSVFGRDLGLLKPSRSELSRILQDHQIRHLQATMREFVFRQGRKKVS